MTSRTEMPGLILGIPIAFFSGLGVAVSVLDDQTSSLVGVAISASLLPPAVNAGMLWATYLLFFSGEERTSATADGLHAGGWRSLILALVNILLIILASMLMFRVKEVRVLAFAFSLLLRFVFLIFVDSRLTHETILTIS